MPKRSSHVPQYCLHKPSGREYVRIHGKVVYVGQYGTDESKQERAFRCLKAVDLEIRPIHHRLDDRVRSRTTWRNPGSDVYFAKPYHSGERGLNENTNGLLRQHFPKGTNFGKITAYRLKKVEAELNARPRKTLGYRTPQEVMRH